MSSLHHYIVIKKLNLRVKIKKFHVTVQFPVDVLFLFSSLTIFCMCFVRSEQFTSSYTHTHTHTHTHNDLSASSHSLKLSSSSLPSSHTHTHTHTVLTATQVISTLHWAMHRQWARWCKFLYLSALLFRLTISVVWPTNLHSLSTRHMKSLTATQELPERLNKTPLKHDL